MSAKKSGVHGDRIRCAKAARDAQHFSLGLQIQAVAGFYFDRRHAFCQQGFQPPCRLLKQTFLVGLAGGAHGGYDAAATTRDFFIAGAGQAQREFIGAVAAIHQMRMAIDQTRRDPAVSDIVPRQASIDKFRRHLRLAADPGNDAVTHHDGSVANGLVRIAGRRDPGVMPDAVGRLRLLNWALRHVGIPVAD